MLNLAGKTAVVTGGSRGIGAAIARRLADAGAHVAVNYAAAEDAAERLVGEISLAGGKAFAVQADVASLDQIKAMFVACDAQFGDAPNLDILINNAGYGSDGSNASLAEENEDHFDRQFAVNAKGPHFVCQQALSRPDDIAGAVMMLVGGDGRWVTGQIIEASGGLQL